MAVESETVKSPSLSAGMSPVGLSSRQFGGGLPGMTGTTGMTSCGRPLAMAATMTLRVWTEIRSAVDLQHGDSFGWWSRHARV